MPLGHHLLLAKQNVRKFMFHSHLFDLDARKSGCLPGYFYCALPSRQYKRNTNRANAFILIFVSAIGGYVNCVWLFSYRGLKPSIRKHLEFQWNRSEHVSSSLNKFVIDTMWDRYSFANTHFEHEIHMNAVWRSLYVRHKIECISIESSSRFLGTLLNKRARSSNSSAHIIRMQMCGRRLYFR